MSTKLIRIEFQTTISADAIAMQISTTTKTQKATRKCKFHWSLCMCFLAVRLFQRISIAKKIYCILHRIFSKSNCNNVTHILKMSPRLFCFHILFRRKINKFFILNTRYSARRIHSAYNHHDWLMTYNHIIVFIFIHPVFVCVLKPMNEHLRKNNQQIHPND